MEKPDITNLLYISYYWPPSGGPGVQRGLKFCKYFPQFGVQPTVLTVDEKQASYPVLDPSFEKEVPQGLQVHRTPTTEPFEYYKKLTGKKEIPFSGFANQKKADTVVDKLFKFVRGNLFIPDARVGWNKHALKKAGELLQDGTYKAVITTSPPHSTQLIGMKLKDGPEGGKSPLAPGLEMDNVCALFPMYETPFQIISIQKSGAPTSVQELDGTLSAETVEFERNRLARAPLVMSNRGSRAPRCLTIHLIYGRTCPRMEGSSLSASLTGEEPTLARTPLCFGPHRRTRRAGADRSRRRRGADSGRLYRPLRN